MTLADILESGLTKRTLQLRRLKFDAVMSGKRAHLEVRPMIAYAIASDTVVCSDSVEELKSLEFQRRTPPSLCLKITNTGRVFNHRRGDRSHGSFRGAPARYARAAFT